MTSFTPPRNFLLEHKPCFHSSAVNLVACDRMSMRLVAAFPMSYM